MTTTKRTLLIVEDDTVLNTIYKTHCEAVLQDMPHLEGRIEQALTYRQAQNILANQTVDFISVDIALSQAEVNKTDQQRAEFDAGGMRLLKELQRREQSPLAVIVSGETLQSYTLDAYRRYGVLAFYRKDLFNDNEYRHAVKAVLSYLDAAQALNQIETELDIESAEKNWKEALEAAKIADIDDRYFPQKLGPIIELKRSELTNPVTGFPNNHWAERQLAKKVAWRDEWGFIRVTVRGFNDFTTIYADQAKPILLFVANLLRSIRTECQTCKDDKLFIGHFGYDKYTYDPIFLIIPSQKNLLYLEDIASWLDDAFAEKEKQGYLKTFVAQFEAKSGKEELTFTLETTVFSHEKFNPEEKIQAPEQLLDLLNQP